MESIAAGAAEDEGEVIEATGSRVKAILVGSIGNLIEWYDVYAYSAFALYFAPAFFPAADPVAQQLSAAAVFAAAFVVRPLGGLLFGWVADRHGRRISLLVSVLLMCFGSLLIAVSPTHESIGAWAAVVLVTARLLQGLSQRGQVPEQAFVPSYYRQLASRPPLLTLASRLVPPAFGRIDAAATRLREQASAHAAELAAIGPAPLPCPEGLRQPMLAAVDVFTERIPEMIAVVALLRKALNLQDLED